MRVKKCTECGEDLYCQKCGARQTKKHPQQLNIHLTEEQKMLIDERAKELGISVNELIRRAATDDALFAQLKLKEDLDEPESRDDN